MDQDFELGNMFKDNIVPLALEYYLDVIDQGEPEDSGSDKSGDSDDSDEDKPPKK